jgi:FkbM family methyltransferase
MYFLLLSLLVSFSLHGVNRFYASCGKNQNGYYGQHAQDKYVYEKFFIGKTDGVFVDIGAYNGIALSNTKFFEEIGWTGICIEPLPEVFEELKMNRKTVCIRGCISDREGKAQFLHAEGYPEMLSGLLDKYDPQHFGRVQGELSVPDHDCKASVIEVDCYLLNEVLKENGIFFVDYLSIDTEGGELEILQTIDFSKYHIDVIDVEVNFSPNDVCEFLVSKGYKLDARLGCDCIFKKMTPEEYKETIFLNLLCEHPNENMEESYRKVCEIAVADDYTFRNFRSLLNCELMASEILDGNAFAHYVNSTPSLLGKVELFKRWDRVGNPQMAHYPGLGFFSASMLHAITHADQMKKHLRPPQNINIAEIGVGFAGQCYALSQLLSVSSYYIYGLYDFPEERTLINRITENLGITNVKAVPFEEDLPEIDLVMITNHRFSRLSRDLKIRYLEKIIKKAKRGYILYSHFEKTSDSMTLDEFLEFLKSYGIRPKVFQEFLPTAPGNRVIIWDRTRQKTPSL